MSMEYIRTNPEFTLSHGSLFSGIGGFDLAAEWAGWENKFFCDFDPFCQIILKHHFPYAKSYSDIKKTDFSPWRGKIDILSGGFPCQPFSQAGKRRGTDDGRYLWPEMLRAIQEIRPRWVLGENVLGIVNWNAGMVFEQVCADLEAQGYEVQPFILPAAGVNAPHRRYRTWFVAHTNNNTTMRTSRGYAGENGSQRISERYEVQQSVEPGRLQWIVDCTNVRYSYGDSHDKIRKNTPNPDAQSTGIGETGGRWTTTHSNKNGDRGIQEITAGAGVPAQDKSMPPADSNSVRPEIMHSRSERKNNNATERPNLSGGITDVGTQWTTTHTHRKLYEGGDDQRKERQHTKDGTQSSGFSDRWQVFPTQSPICGGDDGLSGILDGITFSKWRQEAIKAYGNAIVPQVALRIFTAINQYEAQRNG